MLQLVQQSHAAMKWRSSLLFLAQRAGTVKRDEGSGEIHLGATG